MEQLVHDYQILPNSVAMTNKYISKYLATVGTVEVVLSGGHPPIDYRVN